jgi:predicted Zn-dependent peptidase
MKENKYDILDEVVYSKKLSNGFTVYFYPTEKTHNFYVTISVKYGAEVVKYKKNNKIYNIIPGSAHFLEHKIMNFESYDIMKALGSVSNAYTSYDVTNYNIFGSTNIEDNINLLLKLLFNPVINKENVESEKGIIKEEIDMKDDNVSLYLYNKLRENLFTSGYQINTVIGNISDIEKITDTSLLQIYNDFYVPENMFMCVCGNFDKIKILNLIEDFFKNNKINSKKRSINIIKESDKEYVKVKYAEVETTLLASYVLVGIKIKKLKKLKDKYKELLSVYLSLIISCKFGSTSKLYERYKNEKIIHSMYSFLDSYDDYYVINISANVIDSNLFIKNIKKDIKKLNILKKDFERKKNKLISNVILGYETIEEVESQIVDEILNNNKLLTNKMELINKLNYNDLVDIINNLDISNYSILKQIKK